MKTRFARCCVLLLMVGMLFVAENRLSAATTASIYAIAETQTEVHLVAISPDNKTSERLAVWQKRRKARIDTLFPADELNLLRVRYTDINGKWGRNTDLNFSQEWVIQTSVRALSVSPSGKLIAFAVQQQVCLLRGYDDCFGMSQVVVYNLVSNHPQITGTLSIRADAPRILIGCPVSLDNTSDNVILDSLHWSPNEQTLVGVTTTYWRNFCLDSGNRPLVQLSAVAATEPIPLSTAIAVTISPDSRTLTTFAKRCTRDGCFGEFSWIDLSTNQVIETAQHPDLKDAYATTTMSLVEGANIIVEPYLLPDTSAGLNYAVARNGQITLQQTPENPPIKMAMSTDAQTAYVQRKDGTLWRLSLSAGQIMLSPLYDKPVEYWQPGQQGMILVREVGSKNYSILDAAGALTSSEIDIENILKNVNPSTNDSLQMQSVGW